MTQMTPFANEAPTLMPSPNLPVLAVARLASTANADIQGVEAGDSIDGVVLILGDSVVFKNQTDATENGVYFLSGQGLSRRDDFGSSANIAGGAIVPVSIGTTNGGKAFKVAPPGGALGTVDIVFSEYEEWQGPESKSVESQSFDNTAPDPASLESQEFDITAPESASVQDLAFDDTPPSESSVADQAFDNTAPEEKERDDQSFDNTPPDPADLSDQSFDNTPPEIMT